MAVLWITANDTVDPTGPYTDLAIRTASWILYKLTAEKYTGLKSVTESYSLDNSGALQFSPHLVRGEMYNFPIGMSTFGNTRITLRHQPVRLIEEVIQGTQILSPDSYELRNNAFISRKDKLPWLMFPQQELSVSYKYGTPPPFAGKKAAIRLANELIWLDTDEGNCSLPERVTSVQRQGISYTMLDPQDFLDRGKTGIYEIDMFITSANPRGALKKPQVYVAGRPSGEKIN
jgi:hypothetical protein